jgi:nitroreductase
MEFFETVHARQSVRAYQAKPVEAKQLEAILSAANQSPSAGNVQGYQILIVRDAATVRSLAKASFSQMFITQSPIVLAFCADPARSGAKYGDRGERLYCVQDATIAAAYAQLAAAALGLATCWIGAFDEQEVAKVLGLRADLRPVAMLPVGWPAEKPPRTLRRALNDLVREHKATIEGASGALC